jgi:hypothetical protein
MDHLYSEPVKGDIYRYPVVEAGAEFYTIQAFGHPFNISKRPLGDGSLPAPGIPPGILWPETREWRDRYQDSLSLRVSMAQIRVYMVAAKKRGKKNSRVIVVDDGGVAYTTVVPTVPLPRFGECLWALRMDLEVVSLTPVADLLRDVQEARAADPSLL